MPRSETRGGMLQQFIRPFEHIDTPQLLGL